VATARILKLVASWLVEVACKVLVLLIEVECSEVASKVRPWVLTEEAEQLAAVVAYFVEVLVLIIRIKVVEDLAIKTVTQPYY